MNGEATKAICVGRYRVFLAFALCLAGAAVLFAFALKPLGTAYFPVRFVRVHGNIKYLDRAELEASTRPWLENGYWGMDLSRVRTAVERLEWVRSLKIQRVWPDTLVLRVDEHVPFARFGGNRLLSARGVVFTPRDIKAFGELPEIDGWTDRPSDALAAFSEMQAGVQRLGRTLELLRVNDRNSWSVQISENLSIELGREMPVQAFRRFIATLGLLGERQIQSMVRVDLRYRNGYAVEWKPGTEPEWRSFVNRNDPRRDKAAQSI